MSRKDALLRLQKRLMLQRDDLRQKIADDLGLAADRSDNINDLGETAVEMESTELHSQLAAFESRELARIEAALEKLQLGTYGQCDRCSKSIPLARLQAVPHSTLCIDCQRKSESQTHDDDTFEANWASAMYYERRAVDRELNLSDLDVS